MATTVIPANLSVTITESYELEGVSYGNSRVKTFDTKGKVDQRIMNIAVGEGVMTTIFSFAAADNQGIGVTADYTYFRITNLDDTNFITLQISTTDSFWVKLKAGESFMLMDNEMDAIDGSTTFGAFADIVSISADASTAACDIEYTIVTT